MSRFKRFETLCQNARAEKPPRIDVARPVLARIRQLDSRRDVDLPLVALSTASVLAASIVVVVTLRAWAPLLDPLSGIFASLSMVMP